MGPTRGHLDGSSSGPIRLVLLLVLLLLLVVLLLLLCLRCW